MPVLKYICTKGGFKGISEDGCKAKPLVEKPEKKEFNRFSDIDLV